MSEVEQKPLYWSPGPDVGYAVMRRPDGGMNVVFTEVSESTLEHWRRFALDHLIDSDRLTTNLYDLSQIDYLPDLAVQYAIEVNNDPSVRNIRMAVVVGNDQVREAVGKVAALTTPGGVEMELFEDSETAEAWLARPLTDLV